MAPPGVDARLIDGIRGNPNSPQSAFDVTSAVALRVALIVPAPTRVLGEMLEDRGRGFQAWHCAFHRRTGIAQAV